MKPEDPADIDTDFSDEDMLDHDIQDDGADVDYDYDGDGDDNWEDAEETTDKPAKVKKKGGLFNILVIGGAVLIGGGIFVTQFAGKTPKDPVIPSAQEQISPVQADAAPPPPAATPTPANDLTALQDNSSNSVAAEQPQATPPAPAPQQQGFMNQPAQLATADAGKTDTSKNINDNPAPALPDQPSMTGFDAPPAAAPAPAPAAASDAASTPLPNINQIKKADTTAVAETPAAPAPTPVPAPAPAIEAAPAPATVTQVPVAAPATAAAPTARELELQSKLDAAIDRIAVLEKKLSEVSLAAAKAPAPASSDSAEIASLRADVERLENKFSRITVTPAPSAYSDEEVVKPVVKEAPPKKKKKATPPSYYTGYSTPHYAAPVSRPSTSSQWELRSARPGEAMVAKSGQAELKTIRVGDSIVGIGQIKSISQVGGVWVVQGTSGSIAQ